MKVDTKAEVIASRPKTGSRHFLTDFHKYSCSSIIGGVAPESTSLIINASFDRFDD